MSRSSLDDDFLTKQPDESWREYVIRLLEAAAELEHGLMVQYLYAAYSIDTGEPRDEPTLRNKADEWRNLILTVAREEMGHVLTVQNALCLLGGRVSFERRNFPWDAPLNPFPFSLRPLGLESLSCFVKAEMPRDVELEKLLERRPRTNARRFMETDLPAINEQVAQLRGGSTEGAGVGRIYRGIIDGLKCVPESEFRADTYSIQASWDEWGKRYRAAPARPGQTERPKGESKIEVVVRQMASRTQALEALKEVAGQGEEANIDSRLKDEESHFDRLVEVYQQFVDAEGKAVIHRVPTDPAADGANPSTERITAPSSRAWARLFNLRYRMLLTYLTHTFRLAAADPEPAHLRGAILHKIFGEMYNLKAIAGILVLCPLRPDSNDLCAGPPFEMPATLELPGDEPGCWDVHRRNVQEAGDICAALLDRANGHLAHGGPGAEPYLKALITLDRQTGVWIDSVKEGLRLGMGPRR